MSLHSIATAGLRTIDQISYRHDLRFHRKQNGLAITIELTTSSLPGAPVVDDKGNFVGFISEFDLLSALEAGKDLRNMTADEIMVKKGISIPDSASIQEAVKTMRNNHLLNLPVEHNGEVAYTITRHDLLRAWVGVGGRK